MKKVVKGFASVILASMIVFIGCKPPTSTSDPSTGGSEQTGQSKITVTVKGDERINLSLQIEKPYGIAWSSIKAEIEVKIKPSADWKDDWNTGDYAVYEWRFGGENGEKISDTHTFSDDATVYAVSNYTKWKIDKYKKLVGYTGSKPRGKIILPDDVTSIGGWAFEDCSSLTSIEIPAGVTSIGSGAFVNCKDLKTLIVDEGNTVYKSDKNIIYTKDGKSLIAVAGALSGTIDIPDSVTSIGDSAFFGCSALTGITIPTGVRLIGNWAFTGCSSLSTVNISASVTWIGIRAFSGCSSLTTITIPDSVTRIEAGAFDGCSSLESITIPEGVTSIGGWAFSGCSKLEKITISEGVTSIGNRAFAGCSSLNSVDFTDPKGWAVYKDRNYTTGKIDIDESELKDKSKAAELLRNTYSDYYWKKN